MIIDHPSAVELRQSEALDVWVWPGADTIESELPDVLVAVNCQAEGVDLWDGWGGQGVIDVDCGAIFNDCAELLY